jgi:mutator protein MutT
LSPIIHVVAGAVTDAAGRILIAQRPPGKHLAGGWEFPGGKLEAGESRVAGLARELREELGIEIRSPRPLLRLQHSYSYGHVLLDVWVVSRYRGEPRGVDGQPLRWCRLDELEDERATADLLPADRPIVRALRLPERLVERSTACYSIDEDAGAMAGDTRMRGAFCSSTAEAEVLGGAAAGAAVDFLVLRTALAPAELAALCRSVAVPVYAQGLELEASWELGATGVSLI